MGFFKTPKNRLRLLQASLLIAGVALIVLGIQQGEVRTIVAKSTRICLECIGIG